MAHRIPRCLALGVLALAAGCAGTPGQTASRMLDWERGGDLYQDNCNACHTAQVHWRDKRLAKSWDELRYQVSRWQRISRQNWSLDEIDDVAAYLNRTFYGMPCPAAGCGEGA